jgi:hypothetical protein
MKSRMSWMLFFTTSAALSYALAPKWSARIALFLLISIPIAVWAVRKSNDISGLR